MAIHFKLAIAGHKLPFLREHKLLGIILVCRITRAQVLKLTHGSCPLASKLLREGTELCSSESGCGVIMVNEPDDHAATLARGRMEHLYIPFYAAGSPDLARSRNWKVSPAQSLVPTSSPPSSAGSTRSTPQLAFSPPSGLTGLREAVLRHLPLGARYAAHSLS